MRSPLSGPPAVRQGFLKARIYLLPDLQEQLKAAEAGDAKAIALVRSVNKCLRAVETAPLRCPGCEQIFHHSGQVEAFATTSFAADPRGRIVFALCEECVERNPNLLALALRRAQQILDSLDSVHGGRA
jgi:hypothetical protein